MGMDLSRLGQELPQIPAMGQRDPLNKNNCTGFSTQNAYTLKKDNLQELMGTYTD